MLLVFGFLFFGPFGSYLHYWGYVGTFAVGSRPRLLVERQALGRHVSFGYHNRLDWDRRIFLSGEPSSPM